VPASWFSEIRNNYSLDLYNFFKQQNKLSSLIIPYIVLMLETNFFKDMGVHDPEMKGLSAEYIANYIVDCLSKGRRSIYPGGSAKLMNFLPSFINVILLDTTKSLKPLYNSKQ